MEQDVPSTPTAAAGGPQELQQQQPSPLPLPLSPLPLSPPPAAAREPGERTPLAATTAGAQQQQHQQHQHQQQSQPSVSSLAAALQCITISKKKRDQSAATPASQARPRTQRRTAQENEAPPPPPPGGAPLPLGVTPSKLGCIGALEEELSCGICLDVCVRPCATPCGHAFCRTCLRTALQHKRQCPKCRAALPPPSSWQPAVNVPLWNTIQLLFPRHAAQAPPPTPAPPAAAGRAARGAPRRAAAGGAAPRGVFSQGAAPARQPFANPWPGGDGQRATRSQRGAAGDQLVPPELDAMLQRMLHSPAGPAASQRVQRGRAAGALARQPAPANPFARRARGAGAGGSQQQEAAGPVELLDSDDDGGDDLARLAGGAGLPAARSRHRARAAAAARVHAALAAEQRLGAADEGEAAVHRAILASLRDAAAGAGGAQQRGGARRGRIPPPDSDSDGGGDGGAAASLFGRIHSGRSPQQRWAALDDEPAAPAAGPPGQRADELADADELLALLEDDWDDAELPGRAGGARAAPGRAGGQRRGRGRARVIVDDEAGEQVVPSEAAAAAAEPAPVAAAAAAEDEPPAPSPEPQPLAARLAHLTGAPAGDARALSQLVEAALGGGGGGGGESSDDFEPTQGSRRGDAAAAAAAAAARRAAPGAAALLAGGGGRVARRLRAAAARGRPIVTRAQLQPEGDAAAAGSGALGASAAGSGPHAASAAGSGPPTASAAGSGPPAAPAAGSDAPAAPSMRFTLGPPGSEELPPAPARANSAGRPLPSVDWSRYHLQVIFVDRADQLRARLAAGFFESVAEWNGYGRALYPWTCGTHVDGSPAGRAAALAACAGLMAQAAALGIAPKVFARSPEAFELRDLDAYDVVVALDAATRHEVLSRVDPAHAAYYAERVYLLSDFAQPAPLADAEVLRKGGLALLPRAMSATLAAELGALRAETDVTRPSLSDGSAAGVAAWNRAVLVTMLGAAGLVRYLIDAYPDDLPEYDPL
ncbi:LONRF3 [Scenedesmus sp. PABB004]|nr:LONRF3 [Scenedesmus sp. PABB004]